MKNILFAVLFLMLSIPSIKAATISERMEEKKPSIIIVDKDQKFPTRSPIVYDVDLNVESVNNTLCIMFTGCLPDATITVTDADGNDVVQQSLVTITSGMTLYVSPDDSYPYDIVITSPTLDIVGQITNE